MLKIVPSMKIHLYQNTSSHKHY